jgi:alpha-beta hydrolase superfamily lysophospholipase
MTTHWQHETVESFDGVELSGYFGIPETEQGIIVLLHGYGEQAVAYQELAQNWLAQSYAVYAFDLRGHGKSGGERGHVNRFTDFLDDLDLILARIRDRHQSRPLFLVGQDLGALIAAMYVMTQRPQIAGVILSGLITSIPFVGWRLQLIRLLAKLTPQRPFGPSTLDYWAYEGQGPETGTVGFGLAGMRVRLLAEIDFAVEQVFANADQFLVPMLVIHGADDQQASPRLAEQLQGLALSYDKDFWCLAETGHHILGSQDHNRLWARLSDWLAVRRSRQPDKHDEDTDRGLNEQL